MKTDRQSGVSVWSNITYVEKRKKRKEKKKLLNKKEDYGLRAVQVEMPYQNLSPFLCLVPSDRPSLVPLLPVCEVLHRQCLTVKRG